MFWPTQVDARESHPTFGVIGTERLESADIAGMDLARAKGALAFLKARIVNDGLCELLAEDLRQTADRTAEWARASGGRWQEGTLELRNIDGVLIDAATDEMEGADGGTPILLTIWPAAESEDLVRGHLEHFAGEFGNWTRHACTHAGCSPRTRSPRPQLI